MPIYSFDFNLIVFVHLLAYAALAQTGRHCNESCKFFLDLGTAPALPDQFDLFECGETGGSLETD